MADASKELCVICSGGASAILHCAPDGADYGEFINVCVS